MSQIKQLCIITGCKKAKKVDIQKCNLFGELTLENDMNSKENA
jgi:hypothetical protein